LLRLIKTGNTNIINAWRNQSSAINTPGNSSPARKGSSSNASHSLEDTVRALLIKIKAAADHPSFKNNKGANIVSEKIGNLLKQYYENSLEEENMLLMQFMQKYMDTTGRVKVLVSSGMRPPVLVTSGVSVESFVDLRKTEDFLKRQMFEELHRFTTNQQSEINLDTIEKLFNFFCGKCNKQTGVLEKSTFMEGLRQICDIRDPIVLEHNYHCKFLSCVC
jgi:flagellar hook-associated protein FlgK